MKITIRGPVFETNSSSEHAFMYLSKETFEKWRRGEVEIEGGGYPVCGLRDDDFVATKKKPNTVYDPQTNERPDEEWFHEYLDAIDNPEVKADLLYVLRKYFADREFYVDNSKTFDGSYISMLLIFTRHHGEHVQRDRANKRYVDPEEWGPPYEEALAAFRKALYELEGWEEINDEKYAKFREIINRLREKEELTEKDVSELWNVTFYGMDEHTIKDKKFRAFSNALDDLEDYDIVYQNAHMEVMDNGKNVRIHIWGRDDG
ncbi:MAG: hypothetical protein FWH47_00390 [Methanomassiliicoccaceae archaeon]|nr:hypothetical protein [Methanomassiliicoccaceae archaeon]